ncbi:tetratricopeptide repeat protein [Acinetobacter sp. CFCC 10889]|uniref:tetratricopeptide repeat protein n=1 Tax=Acinetobacter sp. CFCC 10889 TaxID=1775557 RepID=UPI000DCF85C7|nr:SEL1-like repeat protein [Acinetobacter sp. CFCC 10889]
MLVHILKRFLGSNPSYSVAKPNMNDEVLFNDLSSSFCSIESHDTRNIMWGYLRAALRGDQEAQYQMGLNYLNGQLGLDRSYIHAEKWLEQAAHQGHPFAKEELKKAYNQLAFS